MVSGPWMTISMRRWYREKFDHGIGQRLVNRRRRHIDVNVDVWPLPSNAIQAPYVLRNGRNAVTDARVTVSRTRPGYLARSSSPHSIAVCDTVFQGVTNRGTERAVHYMHYYLQMWTEFL